MSEVGLVSETRLRLRERIRGKGLLTLTGFAIILVVILVAVFADTISTHDPTGISVMDRLKPPDRQFLLGTDDFGRDVFSRVIHGTRISLMVSFFVVICAGTAGTGLGLASGYWGGALDMAIMRVLDGLMAFPSLFLALAIMAALGNSMPNLIAALAIVYMPSFARLARNSVLSIIRKEYVEASRACAAGDLYIIGRHVLPNCLSPIIIEATLVFGYAILSEAALSFLGFGVPGRPSWGAILSDGRNFMHVAPWISVFPGIAIFLFVLGVNLTGDGLRDILDPRMN
jgi:peptide/nickel transport system permease protein